MAEQTNPPGGVSQEPLEIEDRLVGFLERQEPSDPDPDQADPRAARATVQAPNGQADDELSPDDLPDDPDVPQPTDDVETIVYDGQEHQLPRAEVRALAQKGFDYTQKMQSLAEKNRATDERLARLNAVEQAIPELQQTQAQVNAILGQLEPYRNVDWVKLATDNPPEWARHKAHYDTLVSNFQVAQNAHNQKRQTIEQQKNQLTAEQLQQEVRSLHERIPAWKDTAKYQAEAPGLRAFLIREGAAPADVDNMRSAMVVGLAYKAWKYDELTKSKADKVKMLRTAPPVSRPGAAQTPDSIGKEKAQKLTERLKRTGDVKDAAAVFLSRFGKNL